MIKPGTLFPKLNPIADSELGWVKSLVFTRSFEDELAVVLGQVRDGLSFCEPSLLDLSHVELCVAVKNRDRDVVYANAAFRHFFSNGIEASGRSAAAFTNSKNAKLTKQTDELILEGTQSVDCEHVDRDSRGRAFTFRTYKCAIEGLKNPDCCIFETSRPIACLGPSESKQTKSLSELHALFLALDAIDQSICRLDARGELTKDIAATVGLSSRSIEHRRKKTQDHFQVERAMDVIRLTIRLEEHGLLTP